MYIFDYVFCMLLCIYMYYEIIVGIQLCQDVYVVIGRVVMSVFHIMLCVMMYGSRVYALS